MMAQKCLGCPLDPLPLGRAQGFHRLIRGGAELDFREHEDATTACHQIDLPHPGIIAPGENAISLQPEKPAGEPLGSPASSITAPHAAAPPV